MSKNKSKKRKAKSGGSWEKDPVGHSVIDSRKPGQEWQNNISAPSPLYDWLLGWLCFAGLLVLAFLLSFHTLVDTDIFWHLKTGELIFQTRRVPLEDIYSFTAAGREWIDSQWLFQLAVYSLHRISGYSGIIVFSSLLACLTLLLILAPAFKPEKYFLAVLFGLGTLLAASIRLKARPEILSFFYAALEIYLLGRFRQGKKWAWYPLPFLLLLWVNSEGLWPVYFAILGAFWGEELLMALLPGLQKYVRRISPLPPGQSAGQLLLCLACSIPLAFLNPHHVRGVVFPWVLFREVSSKGNYIHQLIWDNQNPFTFLPALDRDVFIALIAGSALLFALFLYRRILSPAALVLYAVFLYMALGALRNVALFSIITGAAVCLILGENRDRELLPVWLIKRGFLKLRPLGACIVLGLLIYLGYDAVSSNFFFRNIMHAKFGTGALATEYPIRGGDFLKAIMSKDGELKPLRIASDMESAGYLIWKGYPAWKIYFDPRLEVYGDKFLLEYLNVFSDPSRFAEADARYDFDAAVISSLQDRSELTVHLARNPAWALVYMDVFSVIFLKNKPALAAVIARHRVDPSLGFSSPVPKELSGKWLGRERYCRGYLLLKLGFPALAVPELEEAVRNWPDNYEANFNLGRALNLLQRYAEAVPFLEKAVEMQPEPIPGRIQLGRACAGAGQQERAVSIFIGVLKQHPHEMVACMDLARTYESMHRSRDAREQWRLCQEIYQTNPEFFRRYENEISRALQK